MLVSLQKAQQKMEATNIIGDTFAKKALTLTDGGAMESFTQNKWKVAWQKPGSDESNFIKCSGNALFVNPSHSATPGVPWSSSQIKGIKRTHFKGNRAPASEAFPYEFWIPASEQTFDLHSHQGSVEQGSAG